MTITAGSSGRLNSIKGVTKALSMTATEKTALGSKVFPKGIFIRAADGKVYLTDGATKLSALQPLHLPASADDAGNVITTTYATKSELSSKETSIKSWCQAEISAMAAGNLASTNLSATIATTDWVNGEVVIDIGFTNAYTITVGYPVNGTTANMTNIALAGIVPISHVGTNVTLKCMHSVPTDSVTVVFYIWQVIPASS